MSQHQSTSTTIHIRARRGFSLVDFHELWQYRDLAWILAARDIKVRYKQTVLGAMWAILQPLTTMVVFSIFFGTLGGMSQKIDGGIPYPIYVFCALLPWQLFAHAVTASGGSLIESQNLISKVYFPRIIIPVAAIGGGLGDFLVGFAVLVVMMFCYGIPPNWHVIVLPLLVAFVILTALSVGLWLSALSAMYRDFRYTLTFLVQIWLFATPIAYPATIVPEKWRVLYALNPMTGVVEGFRWALLGHSAPPMDMMAASLAAVIVIFVTGMLYFRRMERTLADWV